MGNSTNLVLKWRGAHYVPKGGYFRIEFPKWNNLNPQISRQKSFFQGGVSCSPLAVLSAKLSCSFQDGNSDVLLIENGVTSDITPSSDISLLVTGFKNPIDTSLIAGFKVMS